MENSNFAAIDIGSNGARLLIKNVIEDAGGNYEFNKVLFLRIPLRLGKDVFTIGEISPERERMMMCMIKSYKQLMKLYRVVEYRACATSAMRDAANGQKILKKIRRETGIGMISDGRIVGSRSYNLGTLRMLGGAVEDTEVEKMKEEMAAYAANYENISIIGSGGNINKLCRLYDNGKGKKNKDTLPVDGLRKIYGEMKDMTYRERIDAYSLKPDRADVIIPAAELFLTVADALGCQVIHVPNISLADCIIDGLYKKIKESPIK